MQTTVLLHEVVVHMHKKLFILYTRPGIAPILNSITIKICHKLNVISLICMNLERFKNLR